MADFPTFRDLFRIARDEVLSRNSALSREVIEREGSDANALVAAGVAVGDDNIGDLSKLEAGFYITSAVGLTLDKRAWDRYQLVRKPAAPGVVDVTFESNTPAAADGTIPVGFRVGTADGREYKTLQTTTYASGSTGPYTLQAQSSLAGANQQVTPLGINSALDTWVNMPPDVFVSNEFASAGAADEELDASLQNRCLNYYATAARGTLKAIEQGALAVPGVETAMAFEPMDSAGVQARVVTLMITDTFTEQLIDVVGTVPTYAAQSSAFTSVVRSGIRDVRAGGIYVDIQIAAIVLLGVTLVLRFEAGVDTTSVAVQARTMIVEYVNGLAPGVPYVPADALNILRRVPGLIVTGAEIYSPAGTVQPRPLEALRTHLGLVLVNTAGV